MMQPNNQNIKENSSKARLYINLTQARNSRSGERSPSLKLKALAQAKGVLEASLWADMDLKHLV